MTDTTARLPDLLIRTTARGDRFGWRMITTEGERFLTSEEQSEKDGSPSEFDTRAEARGAASTLLKQMVLDQPAVERGQVVTMSSTPAGPARLVA